MKKGAKTTNGANITMVKRKGERERERERETAM